MFQKVKQMCRKAKGFIQGVSTKVKMLALTLFSGTTAMAQSTAGDYSAGTTALSTVAEEKMEETTPYLSDGFSADEMYKAMLSRGKLENRPEMAWKPIKDKL